MGHFHPGETQAAAKKARRVARVSPQRGAEMDIGETVGSAATVARVEDETESPDMGGSWKAKYFQKMNLVTSHSDHGIATEDRCYYAVLIF